MGYNLKTGAVFCVSEKSRVVTIDTRPILSTPPAMVRYLRDRFAEPEQEEVRLLTLDAKLRPIGDYLVSRGTVDCALCHQRDVFRKAIQDSAVCIVVAHNHPSGDIDPSSQDIKLTNALCASGEIIGIDLLDHLIIGTSKSVVKNGYLSMRAHGYLDNDPKNRQNGTVVKCL